MKSVKDWQKFLVDNGLIFEINRTVLHPLGLSLIADVSYEDRRKLVVFLVEALDDDPEGFLYSEESLESNMKKIEMFRAKSKMKTSKRQEALGFLVQEK